MSDASELPARRGRAARTNPPNPYEPLHVELDPAALDEEERRQVETRYFVDPARTILAKNDSPDVPFTYSLNPYRGCEHGCVYCLAGDTLILMADGTTRPLEDIRVGDAIYGTERRGWYRRYVKTTVKDHWRTVKPAYRITLEDGTELVASGDHRFLTERGWKFVTGAEQGAMQRPHLATDDRLVGGGTRWLATLSNVRGGRASALHRKAESRDERTSNSETLVPGFHLGTQSREGTASRHRIRYTHIGAMPRDVDAGAVGDACAGRGTESACCTVLPRPAHKGTLLQACDLEGQALKSSAKLQIVSIEPLGTCIPLYDITTGTGDFFANGVVSHNCYARPSHEWLGFSSGLDFETRILVKKEAPRLLAEAFQKPSWTPQVVALSGNTDPYQPAERSLEITRRCLQVFQTHRNPVSIITKGGLITRDLDVLEALAARDLVQVSISVTSLQSEVAGAMEPRAARPALRLRTVERLAEAGVPVHVNIAPVVPGLTDEELPQILEAVAERGATTAAYMILRLPEPVDALFVDWLERHVPARKDKVLRRLRALRGNALNERRFGRRMRGEGTWAAVLQQIFAVTCRKLGLNETRHTLSTEHFRRLSGGQMDLF